MTEEAEEPKRKMPKAMKVKNKMPAPVQITAEQLLREAKERELEHRPPPPKQKITDPDELAEFKLRKRKEFEDTIRKNRMAIGNWLRYAAFEEQQGELARARSVIERALDVDHRNIQIFLRYAEMELRNRQINHARNVFDRAISILPRANQFWYKYVYMEEMLENIAGARQVFERWMEWQPDEQAWHSYINFELRQNELNLVRNIYERFVLVHPEVKNWVKYAKFEERHADVPAARRIYERAIDFYGGADGSSDDLDMNLLLAFAKFEEQQREFERARAIYKFTLDRVQNDKEKCEVVYNKLAALEKKFGERSAMEDVVLSKRKFQYEEQIKENPHNYDTWFDYLRLAESNDWPVEEIRDLYERSVGAVPLAAEKRYWRRYIYLWIKYAIFEELVVGDSEKTRSVYQAALKIIPHKRFTFAKMWLLYAYFEIRQKRVDSARKSLGTAIGMCPKEKLFRGYIELEVRLREFDRCRRLYEKLLEFNPENCASWVRFAELESALGDYERARGIFELAVEQPRLDMPELAWKAYIDAETSLGEWEKARQLYRRLLAKTGHAKVWLSYARFELQVGTSGEEGNEVIDPEAIAKARKVFEEASAAMRQSMTGFNAGTPDTSVIEQRVTILENWLHFEEAHLGDGESTSENLENVKKIQPEKVKRRRKITLEDGEDGGWEEYWDYVFPEDEAAKPHLRLLAAAKKWREKKLTLPDASDQQNQEPASTQENE